MKEEEIRKMVGKMMQDYGAHDDIKGFAFTMLVEDEGSTGVIQGYFGEKVSIHGALLRLEREVVRQMDDSTPDLSGIERPFVKTDFQA